MTRAEYLRHALAHWGGWSAPARAGDRSARWALYRLRVTRARSRLWTWSVSYGRAELARGPARTRTDGCAAALEYARMLVRAELAQMSERVRAA